MIEAFQSATEQVLNPYAAEWVQEGKKVVGYTCNFVPGEILHAANILPYRLRGHGTESLDIADAYYGPFVCSFPKCLLQLIGEGKYKFLDGAIITTGCDSVRRLNDNWRSVAKDIPDILPAFFHYLGAPYKVVPHSVEWYIKELKMLIEHLESHFGVSITEEKLKKSIEAYNVSRQLLTELDEFRIAEEVILSGADMYTVVLAGTVMPRDMYNDHLERLLAKVKEKRPPVMSGRKRIMVAGSICDDAELISLIEDAGAVVVAEGLCFGIRGLADRVRLDGDPLVALAERYMEENTCPRFIMSYDKRVTFLHDKAERARAQGVVFQNVRFCEFHGSENSLLESGFEEVGIPAVRLEREFGPLNETGRVRLRVDALLNRISEKSTTAE
jgi:bcr-type benzoyl-CoA reductase subunit C